MMHVLDGDMAKASRSLSKRRSLPEVRRQTPGGLIYDLASFTIDMLFVAAVIVLIGWAMALIWIALRLSGGPAIFAQIRVGRHGKPFTCFKFRTMREGCEEVPTHEISSEAVTRIGAWLRRTKLDELPQVWNVLRREMTLVGPRPCLPTQHELIQERAARGVTDIRPGITGLAQVMGIDMSQPRRLAEWNARYRVMRSLSLDLRIIWMTICGRGTGDRTEERA